MGKRLTNEEFIERARLVHGDKYDYSKVEYVNYNTKVCIICKICGNEFMQLPRKHLEGCGCPECAKKRSSLTNQIRAQEAYKEGRKATTNKKLTTEEWVKRAQEKYGDKYDYSKVVYKTSRDKILIRCKQHNICFEQTPKNHLLYEGCPECQKENKEILNKNKSFTTEEFIERAKEIHGDKYDYSEVKYVNSNTKVKIFCKKCNKFFYQTGHKHLSGEGCPVCGMEKFTTSNITSEEDFRKEIEDIYKDSSIELIKYCGTKTGKSLFRCKECGKEFRREGRAMTANKMLCPYCSKTRKLTKEVFIEEAKKIHGDKYDYSKIQEINSNREKVTIICPIHGPFEQIARDHLWKAAECPYCNVSHGEIEVAEYLKEHDIDFEQQKTFPDCRYKNPLHFDFYLPNVNTAIEYDGEQHYRSVKAFGGEEGLKETQLRDAAKNEYCKEKGIKLIRIKYTENVEEILNEAI